MFQVDASIQIMVQAREGWWNCESLYFLISSFSKIFHFKTIKTAA